MTSKLPDKPSELIRAGLEDLEKIEKLPEVYEVDMCIYHEPSTYSGLCAVCFAGGMMAMRLGVKPTEVAFPLHSRFSAQDRDKFCALDMFRKGFVRGGLFCLNISFPEELEDGYKITPYYDDPTAFKVDMWDLADTLEGAGL